MACNLSQGRQEVCKESVGGLQGVYFMNYPSSSYQPTFTIDANGQVRKLPENYKVETIEASKINILSKYTKINVNYN